MSKQARAFYIATGAIAAGLITVVIVNLTGKSEPVGPNRPFGHNPNATYNGIPAHQWGEFLLADHFEPGFVPVGSSHEAPPVGSVQAGEALGALGRDGVPYLVRGVARGKTEIQAIALYWLNQRPEDASSFYDDLAPPLRAIIRDIKPANCVAQFGACLLIQKWGPLAKEFHSDLQRLASQSTTPEVRAYASNAMRAVKP